MFVAHCTYKYKKEYSHSRYTPLVCVCVCLFCLSVYFWRVESYVLFGMECECESFCFCSYFAISATATAAVEKVQLMAQNILNAENRDSSSCCLYKYVLVSCQFFLCIISCNELWHSFVTKLKIMPDIGGDIWHFIIRIKKNNG